MTSANDGKQPIEETPPRGASVSDVVSSALEEDLFLSPSERIEHPKDSAVQFKSILIGKPLDFTDRKIFRHLSLIAFFAWVGLGADGLSSSCYGPAEAFITLGSHRHLAVILAGMTVLTVFVISLCYSHILEEFPQGGGGYLVSSKVLGPRAGVVSGSALLVDYVLTITVSIAAAGDALFGLLDTHWLPWKLTAEIAVVIALIVLNLRGVKESIVLLLPIFLVFLAVHTLIIGGSIALHVGGFGVLATKLHSEMQADIANPSMGIFGVLALLFHAYSMGGGTYTGIEAVSNSMPVLREPRVATAKRTMLYMACSLAFTASGLVLGYLLLGVRAPTGHQTMNQLLTEALVREVGWGSSAAGAGFVLVTMVAEGALLIVAAQAGFIDGPRVLANMARDSYVPHWFGHLSDRLTTHNGIVLMGVAALGALVYTGGSVGTLVVMYSINVFITFSLSMIAMCRLWWSRRRQNKLWRRRLALYLLGGALCCTILTVTVVQKFEEGGWKTLLATGICVAFCLIVRREYRSIERRLRSLNEVMTQLPLKADPVMTPCDPSASTAVVLVGGYAGLGIHTFLNTQRLLPSYFSNVVFISVGVVDSGNFKGATAIDLLRERTEEDLERYVLLARRLGIPATSYLSLGTDVAEELERLCHRVAKDFPKAIFFAGQLVFQKERWYQRILHNETAVSLQRRLQWAGLPMVILPTRVR